MRKRAPEFLTLEGADLLASRLRAFWHGRGHPEVRAHVEVASVPVGEQRKRKVFTVRSNLVGGLPPRAANSN
jgi:hypothetical protein